MDISYGKEYAIVKAKRQHELQYNMLFRSFCLFIRNHLLTKIDIDFWGNLPRLILSGADRQGIGRFCDAALPLISLFWGQGENTVRRKNCPITKSDRASA